MRHSSVRGYLRGAGPVVLHFRARAADGGIRGVRGPVQRVVRAREKLNSMRHGVEIFEDSHSPAKSTEITTGKRVGLGTFAEYHIFLRFHLYSSPKKSEDSHSNSSRAEPNTN